MAQASDQKTKRYFLWHSFWCTLFVYGVLALLFWLPVQFEGLNPLADALSDFEATDVVYSRLKEPAPADTSIVIVNIGELDTYGMAALVDRIARDKPKVVGIDAIFNNPVRKPEADSQLATAFSKLPNLVLACKADLYNERTNRFDSLVTPIHAFKQYAKLGFANFITEQYEYGNTCREFTPTVHLKNGEMLNSLALEVCKQAYPQAAQEALRRSLQVEKIDYSRRESEYYYLDWQQALDPEISFSFQNKVVLLGFLGRQHGDPSILDKFFTPLNEKYAGRSVPDMFGVVVHANIISQVKEGRFVNPVPGWVSAVLGFLIVYLNVLGFLYVNTYLSAWYDLVTKTIQFIESIGLLFIVVLLLYYYNIQLDLTIAIGALLLSGDLLEVYVGAFFLLLGFVRQKITNFNNR